MAASYQTLSQALVELRYTLGKDTNTLSDANLLIVANKYYTWIVRELNDVENVNGQISKADLVDGQQEYLLPTDDTDATGDYDYGGGFMQLLRVEVALDGTNWKVAKKITGMKHPFPVSNDTYDNYVYTTATPAYWRFQNSMFFLPFPGKDVTAGVKIFWIKRPAELTATSDIPKLDKEFLMILQSL